VSTLSLLKRKRNERDELLFLNKIETNWNRVHSSSNLAGAWSFEDKKHIWW
jgi:hypothetical protein